MYPRYAEPFLQNLLTQFPAVVLLGPRQAGKTTLAFAAKETHPNAYCLDLELPSAQRQLDDPGGFFASASAPMGDHGAEADLVLQLRNGQTWVIEVKRSSAPTVSKGFYLAAADVGATRKLLVAPVDASYPMRDGIEVMNPLAAAHLLAAQDAA